MWSVLLFQSVHRRVNSLQLFPMPAVMWFMWFPLNVLSHPVSPLIFNCFDGSSKTTPFSIRKYTLIIFCSCRVVILVFFNKYPWRVWQCHFFRALFFSPLSPMVYFISHCFQRSPFQLGDSPRASSLFLTSSIFFQIGDLSSAPQKYPS